MLTLEQLRLLPTPRLVAYFKKHFRTNPYIYSWGTVADEQMARTWDLERAAIKVLLDEREHVGGDRITHKTRDKRRK